ncbi:hypothetical protein PEG85_13180 [Lactococcus cremoris]|uniref:hypothetical protein n=1 Tax=Lactococcus lactis subsp. cremoris TaxID=1359 RepID=UPI0022E10B7B|nr:hypothetical protein [Lactococcus cremoris]MDA2881893.1 hypothetical protein [Lactococcus cremoris]MDA2884384.1 hypothetical protein [Lactococcus cremoris]
MSKLDDLEKKRNRMVSEAEKAEKQAKKYQEIVRNKRLEVKKIETEIIAETMVQNNLSINDLQKLIKQGQISNQNTTNQPQYNQQNPGE